MSVLIKGMEMPKEQITAVINPNGLVEILSLDNVLLDEFYAVELKPHGRLIDADELAKDDWYLNRYVSDSNGSWIENMTLEYAPTIIPEEGE